MVHTENARLLSESAVFALSAYSPVVGFQGGYRKVHFLSGAVQKRPPTRRQGSEFHVT